MELVCEGYDFLKSESEIAKSVEKLMTWLDQGRRLLTTVLASDDDTSPRYAPRLRLSTPRVRSVLIHSESRRMRASWIRDGVLIRGLRPA